MSDEPRRSEPDAREPDTREPDGDEQEPGGAGSRHDLEDVLAEHRDPEPGAVAEQVGSEPEPDPYDPFAPFPDPADQEDADDAEEEGDPLPDAPLFGLLRVLAEEITPLRMDRVWIFPPRRIDVAETAVVVVTSYPESDLDRRRVFAAHYTALDDSDEHRLSVDEYGTAPTERVGRLVEEAVERIKDGPAGAPRSLRIQGEERAWNEALHELAEEHLEARQRNRRLR